MSQFIYRLLQALALRQGQTDTAVTRQITGGRQDQITQATEAHERVCARAQGQPQTRHLGQTAGHQGRTGIEPQLQAVTQPGGDSQHVLDGATHFHADHIVAGVHAQGGAVEGLHQGLADLRMRAGSHQCGRLALRHFLRKTGTTQNPGLHVRCHLRLHFMAQQSVGCIARRLETFAQPGHRDAAVLQTGQQPAQSRHGRAHHDQIMLAQAAHQLRYRLAVDLQGWRKWCSRQVTCVLALGTHGLSLVSIPRPQGHLVSLGIAAGTDGQRRTPGTGTKHYYFHSYLRNIHGG